MNVSTLVTKGVSSETKSGVYRALGYYDGVYCKVRAIEIALGIQSNENWLQKISNDETGDICIQVLKAEKLNRFETTIQFKARERLELIYEAKIRKVETAEECYKIKAILPDICKKLISATQQRVREILKIRMQTANTAEDYAYILKHSPYDSSLHPCQENGGVCPGTCGEQETWRIPEHNNSLHNEAKKKLRELVLVELATKKTLKELEAFWKKDLHEYRCICNDDILEKMKLFFAEEFAKTTDLNSCKELEKMAGDRKYLLPKALYLKIISLTTQVDDCDHIMLWCNGYDGLVKEAKKKKAFIILHNPSQAKCAGDFRLALEMSEPHSLESYECIRSLAEAIQTGRIKA